MIKISEDMGLCLHPGQRTEIVQPALGAPFHRATCPDCGAWAASVYWAQILTPTTCYAEPRISADEETTE
jgi:hypothetical protein